MLFLSRSILTTFSDNNFKIIVIIATPTNSYYRALKNKIARLRNKFEVDCVFTF